MSSGAPPCDCGRPGGAHVEECARVVWLRSPAYADDLTIPAALLRRRPPPADAGVFD